MTTEAQPTTAALAVSDQAGTAMAPMPGSTVRQEFGATQLAVHAETASTAVAAQVQATIQARTIVALQRPRDIDDVRVRILKECRRPGFARTARYSKPIGKDKVEGPSIRFAEAAIRLMGNLTVESSSIYDDTTKRIVRVTVCDLETNVPYSLDVTVEKTVERRNAKKGDQVLGTRLNSYGDTVYILRATEDDMLVKEAARVSKAIRTLGLRLLPGDILEEAMEEAKATLRNAAAKDPEGERKKILDAFAERGIQPSDVKGYLGKDIAQVTPDDLVELRALYAAIRDGEATWKDAVARKNEERGIDPSGMPQRKSAAAEPPTSPAPEPEKAPEPVSQETIDAAVAESFPAEARFHVAKVLVHKTGTDKAGNAWTSHIIRTAEGPEFVTLSKTAAEVATDAIGFGAVVGIIAKPAAGGKGPAELLRIELLNA